MEKDLKTRRRQKRGILNLVPVMIILILLAGIPLAFLNFQSHRTGKTWNEIIQGIWKKSGSDSFDSGVISEQISVEKSSFLIPLAIGQEFSEPPQISHVLPEDLDSDGLLDVIVCDARNNSISWIRQQPSEKFTELVIASDLIAPAHAQVVDFDRDGDKDIMAAVLGMLFPNNDKIGSVVILENDGNCNFRKRVIIDKIARVSDVRAGDLDSDGDLDLAVAQFGYDDGETRWMENLGNWHSQPRAAS